jgi:hypothetical protein
MGIRGAPTATVITSYLMMLAYLRVVGGMLDVRVADIFPWRSLAAIFAASVSAIAVASLIRTLPLDRGPMLACILAVFGCIYPVLFRMARVLHAGERNAVRSLMPHGLRWVV